MVGLDIFLETTAAVLFFALGLMIVVGMQRTHDMSLTHNPLAYATILIFWSSTAHRLTDAYYEIHGIREVTVTRLLIDSTVFVGLGGYWIVRYVVREQIHSSVALFRDYGALRKQRRERIHAVLQINDSIVQGLAASKLALELGDKDLAIEYLQVSIEAAHAIVTEILQALQDTGGIVPGEFSK